MDYNSRLMTFRLRVADLRGRGAYAQHADRHNCIFIQIPKNAGNSIANALFGETCPHWSYRHYQRANPSKFRRYFKFAFVRNPWDRLVSGYFYVRSGTGRRGSLQHVADYNDFGAFVHGWLNATSIWSSEVFKPQHHFICDDDLHVQMDFVGRLENIDADFRALCQRLNVKPKLDRLNASNHRHYSQYYTEELRERVASIYARDIATFGYRFES
jgi:chondroitin 4-sulfotransferase 11